MGLPYVTAIRVRGFKSLFQERRLELRPFTIRAGANSSGKSNAIQPLLMMKQTLDATYDPGTLLLNGPNVAFTLASQFLSRGAGLLTDEELLVEFEGLDHTGASWRHRLAFAKEGQGGRRRSGASRICGCPASKDPCDCAKA